MLRRILLSCGPVSSALYLLTIDVIAAPSHNLELWTGPARGGRGQAGPGEASGIPFQGNHTHTRETGGKVRRCRRTIHTKSW